MAYLPARHVKFLFFRNLKRFGTFRTGYPTKNFEKIQYREPHVKSWDSVPSVFPTILTLPQCFFKPPERDPQDSRDGENLCKNEMTIRRAPAGTSIPRGLKAREIRGFVPIVILFSPLSFSLSRRRIWKQKKRGKKTNKKSAKKILKQKRWGESTRGWCWTIARDGPFGGGGRAPK